MSPFVDQLAQRCRPRSHGDEVSILGTIGRNKRLAVGNYLAAEPFRLSSRIGIGNENLTGKSGDRAVAEGMRLPFASSDCSPPPGHPLQGFLQADTAERKSLRMESELFVNVLENPGGMARKSPMKSPCKGVARGVHGPCSMPAVAEQLSDQGDIHPGILKTPYLMIDFWKA